MDVKTLEKRLREDAAAIDVHTSNAVNRLIDEVVQRDTGRRFRNGSASWLGRGPAYAALAVAATVLIAVLVILDVSLDSSRPVETPALAGQSTAPSRPLDRLADIGATASAFDSVLEAELVRLEADFERLRDEVEESVAPVL